jgi:hypothetical protein
LLSWARSAGVSGALMACSCSRLAWLRVGHGLLPRGGEVQRVVAPVAGIAAPFDQAALFQAVHQRDQPARRGAEPAGDRLLALPGSRLISRSSPACGR